MNFTSVKKNFKVISWFPLVKKIYMFSVKLKELHWSLWVPNW